MSHICCACGGGKLLTCIALGILISKIVSRILNVLSTDLLHREHCLDVPTPEDSEVVSRFRHRWLDHRYRRKQDTIRESNQQPMADKTLHEHCVIEENVFFVSPARCQTFRKLEGKTIWAQIAIATPSDSQYETKQSKSKTKCFPKCPTSEIVECRITALATTLVAQTMFLSECPLKSPTHCVSCLQYRCVLSNVRRFMSNRACVLLHVCDK